MVARPKLRVEKPRYANMQDVLEIFIEGDPHELHEFEDEQGKAHSDPPRVRIYFSSGGWGETYIHITTFGEGPLSYNVQHDHRDELEPMKWTDKELK